MAVATKVNKYSSSLVYRNVMVAMRDGTRLATDIYLPSTDGEQPATGRFPVVLTRGPYGKSRHDAGGPLYTQRGYAFAAQDKRGRLESEGLYRVAMDDGWGPHQDGYDTVEWLAGQPWCSGEVGVMGISYGGHAALGGVISRPPHLKAALSAHPATDWSTEAYFEGGALKLATVIGWPAADHIAKDVIARMPKGLRELAEKEHAELLAAGDRIFEILPLTDVPYHRLTPHMHLNALAAWEDPASYAESTIGPEQLKRVGVPVLHLGSWYDVFVRNTLRQFLGASSLPEVPAVREGQHLILGPWTHGGFANSNVGEREFSDSAIDYDSLVLDWHDWRIRGESANPAFAHRILVYIMGANRWRSEPSWPLPGTQRTNFYLHSNGGANSATGNGVLSTTPPSAEPPDTYIYDPSDPVKMLTSDRRSLVANPDDSRTIATVLARPDVLVYTSEPLIEDVEVTGEVSAVLFADSSARDTDWMMELHDVRPDGRSHLLCGGALRARYRHSRTVPAPLTPGEVEPYELDLHVTGNLFSAGHRIRVVLMSSKMPLYDRNPNAYVNLFTATEKDFVVAHQRVRHDTQHPSCVVLPIVPSRPESAWSPNPSPLKAAAEIPTPTELPASALAGQSL